MFELEDAEVDDFLFLFEAIQDIAILNSETTPTEVSIYQIKKKDRKDWAWSDLTALHSPPRAGTKAKKAKPLAVIQGSPVGKIYAAINAFTDLNATGRFVSNASYDLPLAAGHSAITTNVTALSDLHPDYVRLLLDGLATLHTPGASALPDISRMYLERVQLSVEDPGSHLTGMVHAFLLKKSERHAGQARALVDSLLAKIAPLGAKTVTCKNFTEMRSERGYSRTDFLSALGALEEVPDRDAILEVLLSRLAAEGYPYLETVAIRAAIAGIFRRQVMGQKSNEEEAIQSACVVWFDANHMSSSISADFESAFSGLHEKFPAMNKTEIMSYIALEAVNRCVDPS